MDRILPLVLFAALANAFSPGGDTSSGYQRFSTDLRTLYLECGLDSVLKFEIFKTAYIGYLNIKEERILDLEHLITVIDYTRPSTEKRLYVIDLAAKKLLFVTYVAHGKYTGDNRADGFSNETGSKKSSLGFYITAETFYGKHGYSLNLDGIDTSFNDNARGRGLIVHGAWYVSEEMKKKYGRMGKSWGCPALPVSEAKGIIDTIKDGSCLFIYFNDDDYLKSSKYLDLKRAISVYPYGID